MRKAKVYMHKVLAGFMTETDNGYEFIYEKDYLNRPGVKPVSLTLPFQEKPHISKTMFPFFDGLIPEGWLLEIAEKN
jgi:serine/threonine-protein kinase HipA